MAKDIELGITLYGDDVKRFLELTRKEEVDPDPKRIAFLKESREFYKKVLANSPELAKALNK